MKCTGCGLEKDLSDFYANRRKCKTCIKLKAKEKYADGYRNYSHSYYESNKEKILTNQKNYKERNGIKSAYTAKTKARKQLWRENNREKERMRHKAYHIKNRSKVIEKNLKRKNMIRGTFSNTSWVELCNKYNNVCLCCGKPEILTVDHVIPISKGGTNTIDNIQPLCRSCNSRKGVNTTDYR